MGRLKMRFLLSLVLALAKGGTLLNFTPFECQEEDSALYVPKQCAGSFCFNVDEVTGYLVEDNVGLCGMTMPTTEPFSHSTDEIVEETMLESKELLIYEPQDIIELGGIIVDLENYKLTEEEKALGEVDSYVRLCYHIENCPQCYRN